jgi:RNA polymerase sigma factor (sigma-70 family)
MSTTDELAGGSAADEAAIRLRALAALRDEAIRVVRARIGRPDDAEDHVHEAMLRLAQRPITIAGAPQLRSLLVRAACGIAIDRHRHACRQQRLLGRLAGGGQVASPEEIVADRSEARWLAAGMEALGTMEHDALVHAMEGRRPGEIADLLGVEYKAAENALGRARRKLRVLAASAAMGVAAIVRRLRLDEQSSALTASTLAAALLLLNAGSHAGAAPAPAQRPAIVLRLVPGLVMPVSKRLDVAPVPASAPVVAVHARSSTAAAPARPHVAAPAPPSTPPSTLPQVNPPWQGSPYGVRTGGRVGLTFMPGTPEAWLLSCLSISRCTQV